LAAIATLGSACPCPYRPHPLGKAYEVATALADAEIASEIYSTAGDYDLLVKFYLAEGEDIGHFVNEKVHKIPDIQDTKTIITFKAF
jgi:DNA-binding Lrp family transcriptional regulator